MRAAKELVQGVASEVEVAANIVVGMGAGVEVEAERGVVAMVGVGEEALVVAE